MNKEKLAVFQKHLKKAFEDVFSEITSETINLCDPVSFEKDHRVSIIIGISGNNKGRICLECNYETASAFTVEMNFGDPLDAPNDLYLYMAEFANMFTGRAATFINDEFKEREVWLAPPAIFSGKNLSVISPNIKTEEIFYASKQGVFKVDIGFLEGA